MKPLPLVPAFAWLTVLLFILMGSGCSSAPKQPPTGASGTPDESTRLQDSSVEISYVLGHDHRKILVESKTDRVIAQSYLGKQLLKESTVKHQNYAHFMSSLSDFIRKSSAKAPEDPSCKSPYRVQMRLGDKTENTSGCRTSAPESRIGQIVREAEFLLYSKN